MNRYQFEDLISDYIENKIKSKDRIEFENYFANNIKAKKLLDSVQNNIEEMDNAYEIQVGKDFNKKLLEKIKNQSQKRKKLHSSSVFLFGFNLSQLSIMVGLIILFIFATVGLNNEYKINNFEDNIYSDEGTQNTTDEIAQNYQSQKVDTTTINQQNNKDVDFSKSMKFVND